MSYIAESGSVGDYIDSLTRLRYFGPQALYPGHGISTTPMEDIDQAIAKAQNILASKIDGAPEIFYQKSDDDDRLEARTI